MMKFFILSLIFIFFFFVVPLSNIFEGMPSFFTAAVLFLIFLDNKAVFNSISVLPVILSDLAGPYNFGFVSISFFSSIVAMIFLEKRVNLEKNIRGAVFFTIITFSVYYFLLNTFLRLIF